jgi:sn1-specific diacylglycerol lipase
MLHIHRQPAVKYSKQFVTSVVLGKDVVSRSGLHQLEVLRADILSAMKFNNDPKALPITSIYSNNSIRTI